jgi:hypothetical protein
VATSSGATPGWTSPKSRRRCLPTSSDC